MPLISVIIPTYNRGWIIEEAIESVLSQIFTDFELIVVDDGSTDNTPDILKSYPEIKVIRQKNRGVSAARNTGVKASKGKFVAFLDSDDLWLPEKLQKQASFFEENPSAKICQTEEIWVRNGVRVNPKKKHLKPSGMIFEKCLELCLVSPSAVMISREVFDEADGFDETLPACEDYDLWLRLTCKYPVFLISKPLIIKRGGHEDQLSKMPCLDKFRIKSLVKILKSGELNPQQYRAAIATLSRKCHIYATGCEKRKRHDEARYYRDLPAKFE